MPENVLQVDYPNAKVRELRSARFRMYLFSHTTFTVSLQNVQNGVQPNDVQIKLIEDLINYYCESKHGTQHLKILVRGGDEKYKNSKQLGYMSQFDQDIRQ